MNYQFLQDYGVVGFIILQGLFVAVVGWLLSSIHSLRLLLMRELHAMDMRIIQLEKETAMDELNLKHYIDTVNKIDKKLDLILSPDYFRRCPNINKVGDVK